MYKQTNTIFNTKRIRLFALIINCTIIMKTNSRFSRNVYAISSRIWCNKHLTQPRKNMITMGKGDTSDLMMIIIWAIDKSFKSPTLKCTVALKGHHYIHFSLHYINFDLCEKKLLCDYVYIIILHVYIIILHVYIIKYTCIHNYVYMYT